MRRSRAGMSTLEVMVSLFVIIVMMMMALQSIDNALELRDLLEAQDATTRGSRVATSKIRRDLQLAFLTSQTQAVNTFQTLFVGIDDSPDRVTFTSLSHQRLYRDTRESDQTEITIWAEPAPGAGRGYVLYHRESSRIDEEPDEGGTILPLAHDVRSFELRYLDAQKDEWVEEWDSRASETLNRMPRAVQVGLVLIAPDPEDADRTIDVPFVTTVVLEYAAGYNATNAVQLGTGVASGAAGGANPAGSRPGGVGGGRGGTTATRPGRGGVRPNGLPPAIGNPR